MAHTRIIATATRKLEAATEIIRARRLGLPNARVAREARLTIAHGDLRMAPGSRIGRGTNIAVVGSPSNPAILAIGEGTLLGPRSTINVTQSLTIGAHCEVSWLVQILDTDFHEIIDEEGTARPVSGPIVIGDHVLIGTGVIITKGVTIGDGAVVGAGSVVTRDIPARTLAAGNPARLIRKISDWR